ncbi:putative T7SS-secreted protein [Streptomyces tubercidicus]|uniref:putative T7SS-secreted protein n=1 Tax=Streptomyces tubercidicus TaxID=47759 RepID=UPI002E1990C5
MGLFDDLDRVTQSARDTFADGVQTVAHGTAKMLDDVGAHDWADKADAAGSWAAEGLGAQTRELELNETDDPAQLLHGDASSIRKSAGNVKKLGAAFERTGSALRKMDPSDWHGKAADRFREKVQPHPKRWLTAADSFEDAAAALDHYADTVEWAGKQAREAVERWKQAQKQTAAAVEQYRRKVDAYTQQANAAGDQSPQEPGPFHDPGAEGRKSAEHLLKTARSQRDSAGAQLTVKLARGTCRAPAEPQGLDRLKREAGNMVKNQLVGAEHQLGGIIKTGTSLLRLVRTVNPQDPYNLTHPADYATNLTSVAGGLIHTANHPTELVKGVIGEGWGTDRNQAIGAFATNFIGGGGAVSKVGAKAVAHGMESAAAKDAAKTAAKDSAGVAGHGDDAADAARHADDAATHSDDVAERADDGGEHPDDAAGAGRDLDPDDPRSLPAAVDKNVDIDSMSHKPVWREDHEPVYRNDNRHPQEIFDQGFHPRDSSNADLYGYVEGNHASAFVGTTTNPDANWLTNYRYEVDAPGGIDVNETLPNNKYREVDQEIAFAGGIDRKHIKGAWEVFPDGTKGEWTPNPHYEPHIPKQPVAPAPEAPPASQLPEGWTR